MTLGVFLFLGRDQKEKKSHPRRREAQSQCVFKTRFLILSFSLLGVHNDNVLVSRRKTLKAIKAKPSAEAQRAQLKAQLLENNQKRIEFCQQYTVRRILFYSTSLIQPNILRILCILLSTNNRTVLVSDFGTSSYLQTE